MGFHNKVKIMAYAFFLYFLDMWCKTHEHKKKPHIYMDNISRLLLPLSSF